MLRRACALLIAAVPLLSAGSALAATPAPSYPTFDHIVTVFLENEDASATFEDPKDAPGLAKLVAQGAYVSHYWGAGHVSLDNYIAAFSAQQPKASTSADCLGMPVTSCLYPASVPTLATTMDAKGVTWKSYAEGMDGAIAGHSCLHTPALELPDPYQGPGTNGYATRHNPPMWFSSILNLGANETYCQKHDVDLSQLTADLAKNTLPQWSFVTPDTCHDGHDNTAIGCTGDPEGPLAPNGVKAIDAWLPGFYRQLTSSPTWTSKSLLIVTFDEALTTDSAGCAACKDGSAGGRIGALFLGGQVKPGFTSTWQGDHYGLVKTYEAALGLPTLASLATTLAARATVHDADPGVTAVQDIWRTASTVVAPAPAVSKPIHRSHPAVVTKPSRGLAATGLWVGLPIVGLVLCGGALGIRRRTLA